MESKEEKLIRLLNEMIQNSKPIKYSVFNKHMIAKNKEKLIQLEEINPEVGIARYDEEDMGISTLSIIATITDILCGKRLAFKLDDEENIMGVQWYEK